MLAVAVTLVAYTHAEAPIGEWARGWFGLERNPHDRFGYLVQGFVPAIPVRNSSSVPRRCAAVAGSSR